MKKQSKYVKISKALSGNQQNITKVETKPLKYKITECFNILRNMWTEPEYTELTITNTAWYKLVAFINLVGEYEISGFGRIQTVPDGQGGMVSLVTDFDIIRQEVKPAYVESDEDAILEWMMKLPAEQRNEWTLDWHSHVNMGTSPSGTDWQNYSDMLKARMGNQFPSMIVNKDGEITAQQIISDNRHPEINMFVEKKALSEPEIMKIYEECKEKVERLCTKYVAPVTTNKPNWENYPNRSNVWAGYRTSRNFDNNSSLWDDEDAYDTIGVDETVPSKWVDNQGNEFAECQYCGEPEDPKCTEALGVPICRECFNDYTH